MLIKTAIRKGVTMDDAYIMPASMMMKAAAVTDPGNLFPVADEVWFIVPEIDGFDYPA
jgi:hypothetical protein